MSNLVFFGAGASKPFGIPTMQEMVNEFEAKLNSGSALQELYSNIKSSLEQSYKSSIDIEGMLSVVEGIVKARKPTSMGYYVSYYMLRNESKFPFSIDEQNLAKKLHEKLTEHIEIVCNSSLSDTEKMEIYNKSYIPFFKYIDGETKNINGNKLKTDWKAYTTNYDTIFESFWNSYKYPEDHFEAKGNSTICIFKSKPLSNSYTFSKLHGSLDWKMYSNTTTIIRKRGISVEQHQTEGPVVLFPIQQKDLYLNPWFTLFEDLRQGLQNATKWYVVGYAFNDEPIRNAFQEALSNRTDVSLVLIDPNAVQIKCKFDQSVSDKIYPLPIAFGNEYFPQAFQDYTTNRKTILVTFFPPFTSDKSDSAQIILRCNLETSYKSVGDRSMVWNDRLVDSYSRKLELNNSQQSYKIELSVVHRDEKIKLEFLSNSNNLSFAISYAGKKITDSKQTQLVKLEKNQIQYTVEINTSDMF